MRCGRRVRGGVLRRQGAAALHVDSRTVSSTLCCARRPVRRQPELRPTAPCGARSQAPRPWPLGGLGACVGVTPRQACPRPDGLGRNLRSKTRWFAGFCNSHQVSHFATFFIDARAEISVAESRVDYRIVSTRGVRSVLAGPCAPRLGTVFLDADGVVGSFVAVAPRGGSGRGAGGRGAVRPAG